MRETLPVQVLSATIFTIMYSSSATNFVPNGVLLGVFRAVADVCTVLFLPRGNIRELFWILGEGMREAVSARASVGAVVSHGALREEDI